MAMQHSVLAIELCMRLDPQQPLRDTLHRLVRTHPERSSPGAKWQMYAQLSDLLVQHLPIAVSGCWDFYDDDARARKDFEMWSQGMITREGARPSPSGLPDPYRNEPRFMTCTLAFLIARGAPCERMVAHICAVPQPMLWHRGSFERVLRSVRSLSFASVKGDVAYVIPGDPSWGLTQTDLQAPKFHYLRQIV